MASPLGIDLTVRDLHVPEFLETGTGHWLCDLFPLVSLVMCLPSLHLFWKRCRYGDFAVFTLAFLLAVVFHALHMSPKGLSKVTLLGVPGSTWRTWDVIAANVVLARTLGHAIGARHPVTAAIPNLLLPSSIVLSLALLPSVDIRLVAALSGSAAVLLFSSKVLLEGSHGIPRYSMAAALAVLTSCCLGLGSFMMPHAMPAYYWLWHSLWHVFMGIGFHQLFLELEKLNGHPWTNQEAAAAAAAAGRGEQKQSGLGRVLKAHAITEDEEHEEEEEEQEGQAKGAHNAPGSKRAGQGGGQVQQEVPPKGQLHAGSASPELSQVVETGDAQPTAARRSSRLLAKADKA